MRSAIDGLEQARSTACAALAAALILFAAAPSAGDPGSKAERSKEFFDRAIILFNAGDFKGALENFEESYSLRNHYKVKYNIGVCLFSLKEYVDAGNALEEYMAGAKDHGGLDASLEEKVRKIIKEIDGKTARLAFHVDAEGADILVDDTKIGPSPLDRKVYVQAGSHTLGVVFPDGKAWASSVTLVNGELRDVTVKHGKAGVVKEQPKTPHEEVKETKGEMLSAGEKAGEEKGQKPGARRGWRAGAYAAFGTAAALLLGGTAAGIITLQKKKDIERMDGTCLDEACDLDPAAHALYADKRKKTYDEAVLASSLSTAFLVVAGAAAAVGVAAVVLSMPRLGEKSGKKKAGAVTPLITLGAGASVGIAF
jgi:tetratricopeptide (TPR) repeat protein